MLNTFPSGFEVFTAVMFQVEVFWVVTWLNDVVGYHHFGGSCYRHLQSLHPEDEGSMTLRNVVILHNHTVSRPKRPPSVQKHFYISHKTEREASNLDL
jgi:hypothetical protein